MGEKENSSTKKTTAKSAAENAKTPAAKTTAKASASPKTAAATTNKAATTPKKTTATSAKETTKSVAAEKSTEKVKKAKPAKTTAEEPTSVKGKAAALVKTKNFRIAAIAGLSAILIICLILGLVLGLRGCSVGMNGILRQNAINVNSYSQTTMVGYSSKTLGTVARNKPVAEIKDEQELFPLGYDIPDGTPRYPKYGYTMNSVIGSEAAQVSARNQLIAESSYLTATGTANAGGGGYTWMDENGYLYSGTRAEITPACYPNTNVQRQLYQHTASVGLYLGDVSDDEPGIIKEVTLRPRGYNSYSVTGVYAPAGEVIKIELSDADMTATGGIVIHIGQALYNGQANNIWAEKGQMQRIPHLLNTMAVNKNTAYFNESTGMWTAYVGSFIGGPLYVRNTASTVHVKISGAVAYRHFILGYTTPEEFAELSKSSAPYFDLEVWDRGVLHSGPLHYAEEFSYDELYDAAVLWEKVSIVANANGIGSNCYNQGIVFLYDPFVAAGGAVAFPGRSSVNCPMDWMSSSLNYNSIVTSGSWGNFHEYHHNFQNYGIGYTGEVTNNGLNLVAYSLFTNISSARQLASYGGAGLSGWNCYTSATWAQHQVKTNNINSTSGLAVYATLLHNFGQVAFLNARGYTGVNYFNRWAQVTHYDFSYFDQNTTVYSGGPLNPAATEYPLFVPVSSVYQTGRTYYYDGEKRESTTMQPYVIPYGQPFTVDLRPYENYVSNNVDSGQYMQGSILIGAASGTDFTYKIKSINTNGVNGTFIKTDTDGVYTFIPNSEIRSGKIYVTLEIYNAADGTRVWNGHALDDVDLILEFQQSHEWNKTVLERTTYTYTADSIYTDAVTAFENNFSGYSATTGVYDHSNPTQNANTDIWYCTEETLSRFPQADPELHVVKANTIDLLSGKLYFKEDGKYRIYLRGRLNCALFFSLNGVDYMLGAKINDSNTTDKFRLTDPNTYFDVVFYQGECTVTTYVGEEQTQTFSVNGDNWIYIKEVLINVKIDSSRAGYIGVGVAEWTVPLYTTETKYYDANGKEVDSEEDENYDHSVTKYYDSTGKVVEEKDMSTDPIPPTAATYATAYRQDYEFKAEFTSDYFFTRPINYNYVGDMDLLTEEVTQTYITGNYVGWDSSETFVITNLFDGDPETYIHSGNGNQYMVSESNPALFTVELSDAITANVLRLYPSHGGGTHPAAFPKNFSVEGSLDGETYFDMGSWTGKTANANTEYLDFYLTDMFTFQYYRLTVTATNSGTGRLALAELQWLSVLSLTGNGNNFFSPDNEMFTYKGNWNIEACNANFGHVYVGKDATVEFGFEGTRFAILASKFYGRNYEVYVDGKAVESIEVKENDGDYAVVYLTPELEDGKHSVVIYCEAEGNIDSIVIW